MKQNFDSVIEILKNEGLSDEQTAKFLQSLNNALAQQLYILIGEQLSEEDMQKMEMIDDDGQREASMQQLFEQKTGQSLKNLSDQFVNKYVEEFLAGYQATQAVQSI